jgi:hypothetical protein
MTNTMMERLESMKQFAQELMNGSITWEDQCGYSINEELSPFIILTEELHI